MHNWIRPSGPPGDPEQPLFVSGGFGDEPIGGVLQHNVKLLTAVNLFYHMVVLFRG